MDRFIIKKEKLGADSECGTSCAKHDVDTGNDRQSGSEAEDVTVVSRNETLNALKRIKEETGDGTYTKKIKKDILCGDIKKTKISGENLNCDYIKLYSRKEADALLQRCEQSLEYFTGDLAQVKVYGKWHDIHRKQVSHGDPGITYRYSGISVPAKPWTPLLLEIRDRIQDIAGYKFNFVLINRYADGNDYIGEHRDDERDLVATSPIASVSLGQQRDFIFRHCEARGPRAKRKMPPVKVELEHGSLLLMNHPTNVHWYHSLPVRKRAPCVRVNMTFRDIVTKK